MRHKALAAVVLAISAPAWAKQEYAAYDGGDAIQQGNGGTKVSKNGVDFWTTGAPPRRYQILGILTDKRKDRMLDGEVIGSASIARRTLEAGGSAVIVMGAETKAAGVVGGFNAYGNQNSAFGTGYGRTVHRTTTQLLVIKYLQ